MRVHFGRGAPKIGGGGGGKDLDEEIGILGMPGDRRAHPETELIRKAAAAAVGLSLLESQPKARMTDESIYRCTRNPQRG